MGTSYYIVLDREVEFDPFVNGKAVAQFAEHITEFCYQHGLKDIESFINLSLESLAEFIDDIFDLDTPDKEINWFCPQEGIVWINQLINKLHTEQTDFETVNVIIELNEYMDVLSQANKEGAKWHLAIDF